MEYRKTKFSFDLKKNSSPNSKLLNDSSINDDGLLSKHQAVFKIVTRFNLSKVTKGSIFILLIETYGFTRLLKYYTASTIKKF